MNEQLTEEEFAYLALIHGYPGELGWYQLDIKLRGKGLVEIDNMKEVLAGLQTKGLITAERPEGAKIDHYKTTSKAEKILEVRRRSVKEKSSGL